LAGDDSQLLAELEIREVKEKLARVRALVDRADHLLATVLACCDDPMDSGDSEPVTESKVAAALQATLADLRDAVPTAIRARGLRRGGAD
jgi:hypothetical protein